MLYYLIIILLLFLSQSLHLLYNFVLHYNINMNCFYFQFQNLPAAWIKQSTGYPHKIYIHFNMDCGTMELEKWGEEKLSQYASSHPPHFPSGFFKGYLLLL